jgi:hypothetical protein
MFFNPEKYNVYSLFSNYFDNMLVYKIEDQDDMSVYGVQVNHLLLNEKRYIIVLVDKDSSAIGTSTPLNSLEWKSLQCRTIEKEAYYSIPKITITPKRDEKYNLPLKIETRNNYMSIYKCPLLPQIQVGLIHVHNLQYEYPDEGNLVSSLETYQTVICFL